MSRILLLSNGHGEDLSGSLLAKHLFKKGDLVTFEPNTSHSSFTKKGCLILTFMRGQNNQIKEE